MAGLFIAGFAARILARLGRDAPDLFKMADPAYRRHTGEPNLIPHYDLLILIDSASRQRYPVIPNNVKRTVNLFATEPMPLWLERFMTRITYLPRAENIALDAAHGLVDRDGAARYAGHRSEPLQHPDDLDWHSQYAGWDAWDFVAHFARKLPDVGANAPTFA